MSHPPPVGNIFPKLEPGGKIVPAKPQTDHAPGCYYVNVVTGLIQRECNPLNAALLAGAGFMGKGGVPATPFNAFPTFEEAKTFADEVAAAKGGISGITGVPIPGGTALGDGGQTDWTNLTVRIAEFAIGAILITVGLVAILGKTKAGQTVVNVVGMTPPGRAVRAEQTARQIVRERAETKRIKKRVRSLES